MYKKIIITLLLTIGIFLTFDKVSAEENEIGINNYYHQLESIYSKDSPFTNFELNESIIFEYAQANGVDTSIYNGYFCYTSNNNNVQNGRCYVFNKNDAENKNFYFIDLTNGSSENYELDIDIISGKFYVFSYSKYLENLIDFKFFEKDKLNTFRENTSMLLTSLGVNKQYYFSNTDIYCNDIDEWLSATTDSVSEDEEYTVNFHLNGGFAVDSYQSNIEKNNLIEEVKQILGVYDILDSYPSLSGTINELFIDPSEDKFSNFCKDWLIDLEIQYEALLVYEKLINKEYAQPITYTKDFSIKISSSNFENYLLNQIVKDEIRHFNGWYYDEKLLNKVKVTDDITSNIDLYAKWSYESVDDLLNNVNFKKHTFNTKYEYAIISLGDNTGDIYMGLKNRIYNLEVYEYIESSKQYIKGSTLNLVPIFLHDSINYYKLDPIRTDNINIIVLPKSKLESIENGVIKTYYDFYLSDNVYITYTNNLEKTIIYDKEGNSLETDLKESYDYSQSVLIKNDTKNNLNTFIKPIEFIISSITDFYNNYCLPVVQKFFYLSFIILIVLFVIRLIW